MAERGTTQEDVLDVIEQLTSQTGRPPTRSEVMAAMGFRSHTYMEHILTKLRLLGLVTWTPHVPRTLRTTRTP